MPLSFSWNVEFCSPKRQAKLIKHTAIVLLFIATGFSNLRAQRVLTLDSVYSIAVTGSPELPPARLAVQQAELGRREVLLPPFPALHYKAGASYAPTGRNWGYDPAITNEGQVNGQLSIAGTIYQGGRRFKRQQADLDVMHAQASLSLTQENLRFEISQSFLDALRAQGTARIERESIAELTAYRDFVERLFKGGAAAYTDLLKTEVQLGTEEIALDKALAEAIQAKFAIAALMGSPSDTSFSIRGSYDSVLRNPEFTIADYDSLITLSISLAQNELDRAKLDIELAKAQTKPTIDINLDAGLLTSVQNLTAPPGERNGMLGASAGITIEGPILDWGLNKIQVQEKQVAAQMLEAELNRQKRELRAQLVQLQLLMRTARERLVQIRDNLKKAMDAYELEKAKYAVGGALASEVLDAHKQITDTKLAELDILNDIETYRANLTHLTAKPSTNTNANANTNSQNGQ